MYATILCLQRHDLRLVVLAGVICILACAAALSAFRRAAVTQGLMRWTWSGLVVLMLASGVWATHFVAMLAYQPELRLGFEIAGTAASFLCAAVGFGAGIWVALRRRTAASRGAAGAIWGLGIAALHYTGVAAVRLPATIEWDFVLAGVAVLLGMALAAASLVVARRSDPLGAAGAALLLTLAICSLHFTAMGAITLHPAPMVDGPMVMGRDSLALAVGGLVALILFGGGGMLAIDGFSRKAMLASLHSALDHAPTAVGFFDADRRLTFYNDAYLAVLNAFGIAGSRGASFSEIVGRAQMAGLADHVVQAALAVDHRYEEQRFEAFQAPTGQWYDAHVAPSGAGGFVIIINDITIHREVAEREAGARAAAEEANAAKTEFLANMSHEIRTPLNAVLGMVQVMERDPLDEVQRERLKVIGGAGRGLLSMLNDVLDLTKIEAGKVEVESLPFELEEVVDLAAAAYAPLAQQKDLTFRMELDEEVRGSFWTGDPVRLRQVLSNLLSNALKFTQAGEVVLRVASDAGGLRFAVSDTGVGIPSDKLAAIFEKFTQADASTTRRFGGTGLGLAICDQLVQLMGGRLEVASEPGSGSCFSFRLPLQRVAPGSRCAEPSPESGSQLDRPLRILAAEDNVTNQLILTALLDPLGVELTLVGDGLQAIEALGAAAFDLVLMDAQMPRMGGVEAAIEIRRRETADGAPRTPIIALTANVMRHQLEEYARAGMDGFVAKPIDAAKLVSAIERALAGGKLELAA